MIDWCPNDVVCSEEPTCQNCGEHCAKIEYVFTGDMNSYKGWELWCYCDKCKMETFHKLIKA